MLSISIGPLAFPVAPLITLAAIWIGAITARWLATRDNANHAENSIWLAAILGLVAARIGYLVTNHDAYRQFPWSALDVRDGGWLAWAGFVVALPWLALRGWRNPTLRRSVVGGGSIAIAIWLVSTTAIQLSQSTHAERPVPPIVLANAIDGQQQLLSQVLAGKPTVLNLWATWCGPCRIEMPTLANAQKRHADVQIVFANQGESADAIRTFLAREKLSITNVWIDKNSELGPAIGSAGLPTTLFFDASGRQVDAHFGIISEASLHTKMLALRP